MQDLSDEGLLQMEAGRYGFVPSQVSGVDAFGVQPVLEGWQDQWAETQHQGVPVLERPDQTTLVGLVPMDLLQRFLAGE